MANSVCCPWFRSYGYAVLIPTQLRTLKNIKNSYGLPIGYILEENSFVEHYFLPSLQTNLLTNKISLRLVLRLLYKLAFKRWFSFHSYYVIQKSNYQKLIKETRLSKSYVIIFTKHLCILNNNTS